MISKYRPRVGIFAFAQVAPVCNRMNLLWGVHPVQRRDPSRSIEGMVATAERELIRMGQLKETEVLGVVAGTQMSSGSTNFMRLHTVRPGAVKLLRNTKRVARSRKK
jgi:pyruvate kinase